MEPIPVVTQIMVDGALAFALRFDQPANHVRSTLTLLTPDGTRMLRPAQRSTEHALQRDQPADARVLPAYVAGPTASGETLAGTIPFTVAR